MDSRFPLFALLLTLAISTPGCSADEQTTSPVQTPTAQVVHVVAETTMGNITLELFPDKAPETVANFLKYVDDGFYNGTIFHRVIDDFMIQGGGLTVDMVKKATRPPVGNEADNGLRNTIGTIAMARTPDPHSATSQFFINVNNNVALDHREKSSSRAWGYTVFGRVAEGIEVVNAIKKVRTGNSQGRSDVPVEPIIINQISRIQLTAEPTGAKQ
ncbi:MAG: peptidylprolyl isomerase [Chromatiales bacterium]|nr:peptidylprolyl isomerase [Chromatiales bacterium]